MKKSSSKRTLICLGGGIEAVPIIERAKSMGIETVMVDQLGLDAPAVAAGVVDVFITASCYDAKATVKALSGFAFGASWFKPDAVLCAATDVPHVAAAVAAYFGLPGLSVEAAALGVDKLAQKHVLKAAGLPVPWFTEPVETDKTHKKKPLSEFKIPARDAAGNDVLAVIKPVDSRGARGVTRFLPGVLIKDAVCAAWDASPSRRIMAEQWLSGPQLSTESIVQDGRVLFTASAHRNYDRLDEFAPSVIENGCEAPWQRPTQPMLNKLIERACAALGWDNLTVKGDLVRHGDKYYIIELAPRLSGGFFSSHTVPWAYGVDFVGAAISLALGEKLLTLGDLPKKGYVCQRYLFPPPSAIGKEIVSVTEYDIDADLWSWNVRAGDTIRAIRAHPDRLGQSIATGKTPDEARKRAEEAVHVMWQGLVLRNNE